MAVPELVVDVLTKALPPLVTGVGGVLVSVWKMTHNLARRLEKVEEHQKGLKGTFEILVQSFKELEKMNDELRGKQLQRILDRLAAVERRLTEQEQEQERINEVMMSFVKEQNEQWQAMNRNLGRLEGALRGRESFHE